MVIRQGCLPYRGQIGVDVLGYAWSETIQVKQGRCSVSVADERWDSRMASASPVAPLRVGMGVSRASKRVGL